MNPADRLATGTLRLLKPPPRLSLPDWVEAEFRLPERSSAQPGRFNLWKYQRGWLEAIGDPLVPRVTLMKAARLGFSKCLIATIGSYACNDPCSVILLVPTDDDARRYAVDEVEPSFEESPALHDLIQRGRLDGRNTLVMKAFNAGGSLKILAARAPRNLRMHDAKVLLIDEADAMEVTVEGDPILLAEKRTVAHPDRKIVCGSTPTSEDTSVVARRFDESTQEVFEVPCPECGVFNEISWSNIEWNSGEPETAQYMCPHCKGMIDERRKPGMVDNGRWRALKPDVVGHRGFRINALVSMLPNASWGQLAREYLDAKRGGPHMMQVFYNTVLAKPWRTTINRVDASMLADRAEPWGLPTVGHGMIVPDDVVLITAGVDMQDDRVECTLIGFSVFGAPCILGHVVFPGNTLEDGVWKTLDGFLKTKWRHPNGWAIGIDGTAIDSGGRGGRTQRVYDFAYPRMSRYIFAIKGLPGPRKIWTKLTSVKGDMRAFGVAVDVLKTEVLDRLAREPFNEDGSENPQAFRLSDQLTDEFLEQSCNETRRIRFVKNRPIIEFQPKRAGAPTEALDCIVYALAVRQSPSVRSIDLRERAARRQVIGEQPPKQNAGGWAEKFAAL